MIINNFEREKGLDYIFFSSKLCRIFSYEVGILNIVPLSHASYDSVISKYVLLLFFIYYSIVCRWN